MVTLQTRSYQVLLRIDFSSSSSHGCLGLATSPQSSCCNIKALCIGKFRWNNSHNRKKSLLLAECNGVLRVYATNNTIASPSKKLGENAERSVCGDLADIASLSDTMQRCSACNGFVTISERGSNAFNDTRILANEGAEADRSMKESMKEEVDEQGKLVEMHPIGSFPLEKDRCLDVPEDEIHIIEEERLRRKRISEANKNQVPWNKGKGKGKKDKQDMQNSGAAMSNYTMQNVIVENYRDLLVKEKQRRQRIAAANAGKVAWNKGRELSEEIRQRISERTAEAMKNPKVRDKLRTRSTLLSNETKSKIKATMLHNWRERKKLKSIQETCIEEWKECVADSARRGFCGDIKYSWNSYITIRRELQNAWRSKNKRRSCKEEKVCVTSAHRIKEAETKTRRTRKGTSKTPEAAVTRCRDGDSGPEIWQARVKDLPPYRNPSNSEMLERLKQIRAKRLLKQSNQRGPFKETNQTMAVERARILMGRAQMAACSLEARAGTDKGARLSLQDARQLLSEAEESLKGAGFEAEDFMQFSEGE